MGEYEDRVREAIKEKFGSVPKMAEAVGIAPTTIYHALERGMENTRTETSRRILNALFEDYMPTLPVAVDEFALNRHLAPDEQRLLALYRSMNEEGRSRLLEQAAFLSERHQTR